MADTFDDARAGYTTELTRNGRPIAALVPIDVARAYADDADTRERVMQMLATALGPAVTDLESALERLRTVITPASPDSLDDEPRPSNDVLTSCSNAVPVVLPAVEGLADVVEYPHGQTVPA